MGLSKTKQLFALRYPNTRQHTILEAKQCYEWKRYGTSQEVQNMRFVSCYILLLLDISLSDNPTRTETEMSSFWWIFITRCNRSYENDNIQWR